MAVTFRAVTSAVADGVSTAVLGAPAATQAGDVLVLLIGRSGSTLEPEPSGYTYARHYTVSGNGGNTVTVFTRTATGSDPSVTLSPNRTGIMAAYVGVDTASPVDASAGDGGTNITPLIAPSVTTSTPNTLVLSVFGALESGITIDPQSGSGMTSRVKVSMTPAGGGGALTLADAPRSTPGATLNQGATASDGGTFNVGTAQTVALRAANLPPNAPILLAPADASTIDRNVSQRFDWDFSDPDAGDSQSAYNFRYRATGAATWTETGWVGVPQTYRDVAGGTFLDATTYEWQVATKDAQGVEGPFSSSWFFTAASPSSPATITYPTSGGTVDQVERVDWSTPTQESYQVRRVADNAGTADTATVYYDSGEVVSTTARTHALDFATNDRYEHVQVRIKDGGLWSAWASVRVLVSYTAPPTPTVTPAADDAAGAVVVTYSTPTPGAGEPTPEYADIEVRDTTGRDRHRPAEGVRVATLQLPSGTFIDWLPAAGINYEYRVTVVGDNGTTAASAWTPIDANAVASVYYGGGY